MEHGWRMEPPQFLIDYMLNTGQGRLDRVPFLGARPRFLSAFKVGAFAVVNRKSQLEGLVVTWPVSGNLEAKSRVSNSEKSKA